MSHSEFIAWTEFYRLFPFDDYHRFYRPAALVATAMGGGELQKRLEWLQPTPTTYDYSEADMNTFRAFGIPVPKR